MDANAILFAIALGVLLVGVVRLLASAPTRLIA